MATRTQPVTPHQSGQNTNAKGQGPSTVPVTFKMSKQRNIGQPDMLQQSLTTPPRELDDTQHFAKRKVEGSGHHYQPEAWGKLRGKSQMNSKATGLSSHTSPKGKNALGAALNKVGQKSGYPGMGKKGSGGGRGA